jgi:hypothetical protein
MTCLSILTEGGRDIQSPAQEAFGVIGCPDDGELRKRGVDDHDIRTAQAIRETMR